MSEAPAGDIHAFPSDLLVPARPLPPLFPG
jgi:hypothetical protein